MMIFLLLPLKGIAEDHISYQTTDESVYECDCEYHLNLEGEKSKTVIGNGRQFIKQDYYHTFHGKQYPVYKDASGVEAYFEGLIVLELGQIQDYDSAIAWSVAADEMDTYHDFGITLLTFKNPQAAEIAYYKLADSLDPNIIYMEMALIEKPIW